MNSNRKWYIVLGIICKVLFFICGFTAIIRIDVPHSYFLCILSAIMACYNDIMAKLEE